MAKKTVTFTVEGKKCVLNKPDFKQISLAFTALTTTSGSMDLAGGGETLYNVCMAECDKEIKEDGQMMFALCMKIGEEYLIPFNVDVKKN